MTTENHKVQLEASMDASGVREGVDDAKRAVKGLKEQLERDSNQMKESGKGIGDGFKESSKTLEGEARKMAQAIERATAAAKAGERGTASYYEAIANQRGINTDALKPYLDGLRQAEAAQKAAQASLGGMQMSAKQTAAALRQVPAQFTDIFVSLASGQQPLTVLLQQGGQLKDVFGGAGAAAKALGGYVVGLINPFTLLAAGVGAVALGYYKGSQEAQDFNKALILSGNQAGLTASQFTSLAAGVASLSGGTIGKSAEAITLLSTSGVKGAANMRLFAAAAVELERVGGPAVEKTAQAFAELAKSPYEASVKLNEAMNYLSSAVLQQIKSLQDQGRSIEAADVAQRAYFDAIKDRTPELRKNLGYIEEGWLAVKRAIAGVGDAFLSIGRQTSALDKVGADIDAVQRKISQLEQLGAGKNTQIELAGARARLEALKQQQSLIQENARLEQRAANARASQAEQDKAANEWLKEGEKYLSKQEQMELKIAEARNLGLRAKESEAQIEKRILAIREKYSEKSTANPFAGDQEAAKEWLKFYQQFADNAAEAEGKVAKLTKTQTDLVKFLQSPAYANMAEPARQLALEQAYAAITAEQLGEAQKEAGKIASEARKEYDRWIDSLKKGGEQAEQQIQKLVDEEQARSLMTAGYLSLAQAVELVTIKRLQEKQVAMMGDEAAVLAIQKEIDARKKLVDLIGSKEAAEASEKAAKKAVEDWQRAAEKIEDAITDSLMRGFESGKGFAENLRDTVENMFKTMVLRPVVSAIVQPVASSLTGYVTEAAGLSGSASSASSLLGTAGTAASIWGSTAASGATAEAYIASQTAAAAGSAGSSALMTSLGTAAPYLAAALAIYSIAKSLDNSGTPHTGASSDYSAAAGLSTGAGVYGVGSKAGDYSTSTEAFTTGIVQSVVGILDSTATTFGQQAGYAAAAGFADDSSKDGAWGSLAIKLGDQIVESFGQDGNGRWPGASFADGTAGTEQYLAAVSADVRSALDSIGLPDWATSMLDKLGDAPSLDELASVVATINATESALVALGDVMPGFANLTDAATSSLLNSFGGIDALNTAASGFYSNFYSEADRTKKSTELVTKALQDLGYTMPMTRDQFRDWVNEQLALGDAGANTAAELLKLQSSVAALVPWAEAATGAVDDTAAALAAMAEAGQKAIADLMDQQGELMVDLLRAQGDTAAASALERQRALAKITEGLSTEDAKAATAIYDYNQAIKAQTDALNAASDAAAEAISKAQAAAQAAASESYSLTTRLLTAQGNTAELRKRELEALDPSNRALLEQIYALEDQKAAQEAATQAAQAAAQAAEQLTSAWQSVTDSLVSEVERIRGLAAGDSSMSYQMAAARFGSTTSLARGGDQDAAKLLPSLSQTMLTLAEAQATSLAELQRIRNRTASSLEQTSQILAAQYGLTLPAFAVGTNYVPQDMAAIVHKGEAIVPAAYNPANGGGIDGALIDAINGLRDDQRVQMLAMAKRLAAIEKATSSTADVLDRVTEGGDSMRTQTA